MTQVKENVGVNNLNINVRAGKLVLAFASPSFEMGHLKSQGKGEQCSCVLRCSCVCLELVQTSLVLALKRSFAFASAV